MSIFSNNMTSKTTTEIILQYACDIFREWNPNYNTQNSIWDSAGTLYKGLINKYPPSRTSVINCFLQLGIQRYYDRVGKKMRPKYILWPEDTYMKGNIKEVIFEESNTFDHTEGFYSFAYGTNSYAEGFSVK
jgi:hypothetical protein